MADGEGLTYKRTVRCGCGRSGCSVCRAELEAANERVKARTRAAQLIGPAVRECVDGILKGAGW